MKIGKLLENITKGKIENHTKIKIDNGIIIIYRYNSDFRKSYFEDISGKVIDIMDYLMNDFEPVIEHINKDVWDEVNQQLNKNIPNDSNIQKTIGISNNGTGKFPRFTEAMIKNFLNGNADIVRSENGIGFEFVMKNNMQGKYVFNKDGSLQYISFYERNLKDYSFEENQSIGFYYTAEGYYDASISIINDYEKRFQKVYNYGDLNRNNESFGYNQDAIIKTLLAFACECYLKSFLLNQGKTMKDIKDLSHGLVDLYNALDSDTFAEVFLNMEQNGYSTNKYKSQNIPYDPPDLTEKFMIELGVVDDAFVDSRYCAEKDKNTNYQFLYKLACSLRNVLQKQNKLKSPFDDEIQTKK